MQQIIQHLFRVDSLEEVPRERLEELVATYPSYGMGRYLLSRKLHTEDAGHFSEETQKTNLYFSNPFWLHWLLQNEVAVQKPAYTRLEPYPSLPEEASPDLVAEPSPNLAAEETMIEDEQSWGMPEPDDVDARSTDNDSHPISSVPRTDVLPAAEQAIVENEFPIIQEAIAAGEAGGTGDFFQEGLFGTETQPSQETASLRKTEGSPEVDRPENIQDASESMEKPVLVDEPGVTQELNAVSPSAADALLQSLEEARGLRHTLVHINEGEDSEQVSIVGNSISSLEQTLAPAEMGSEEDNSGGVVGIAESRAEEAVISVGAGDEKGQEHQSAQTLESSVEAAVSSAAVTAQAAAPAEQIVVFEPYHTIDYFASVGIKLIQEENPSDKLGKQLKSFTEWLKVMRKLPQKNQEIVPDVAVEHQIQAIAAHSITGKEVLTETMAEVLVKQGMREKAVDVYHKLSLLNPEKSAYFATKIEKLKID